MTVHFISVGLSILDNLRDSRHTLGERGKTAQDAAVREWKPFDLLEQAGVAKDKDRASDWLTGALALPGNSSDKAGTPGELAEMTRAIEPGQWPNDISAEIVTFVGMPRARRPLPDSDIAVLVCSDTSEGLLAGTWNAAVLADADLSRVCYLDAPTKRPDPVRRRIVQVRVPHLDASDEDGFRQAMGGLGVLGRNLLQSVEVDDDEPFQFSLSGGFKAAIPYLIGLAEGMRSISPHREVNAFVQHETAGRRATPATPIRLPLRRISPDKAREELTGYDSSGVRKSVPKFPLLDGYAYDINKKKTTCTLTAFGAGLRALFGVPPEGSGE
jgi:hypothetical protein